MRQAAHWQARRTATTRATPTSGTSSSDCPRGQDRGASAPGQPGSVEASAIIVEQLTLGGLGDIGAGVELRHRIPFTIAVRDIRGEDEVVFSDQRDGMGQERLIHLEAEVDVAAPRIVERALLGTHWPTAASHAHVVVVLHALYEVRDPLAASLKERHAKLREPVEHAAADN